MATLRVPSNLPPPPELTGARYGRLTVIELLPEKTRAGKRRWRCRCDCGQTAVVETGNLRSGNTTSCGCTRLVQIAKMAKLHTTHGMTDSPEFRAWKAMNDRCARLTHPAFSNYGGRGIAVYPKWQRSFENFYADIGPRPSSQHSLDRIDNALGYEPGNVRWATWSVQMRNRRVSVWLTHEGRTMILTDWAREIGIDPATLKKRLERWPREKALSMPCLRPKPRPTSQAHRDSQAPS